MTAFWIAESSWKRDADPVSMHPALFRRDVELPAIPTRASMTITAHARYVLYVNGRRVNAGPARCYPQRQLVDEIDLMPYLCAGKNSLAVYQISPTGVTGYSITARPGIYATGEIVSNGATLSLDTDGTWQSRSADWITSEGLLLSLPTGTQEHHDFSRMPRDVLTGSLDGFTPVRRLGCPYTPPYLSLEPRPIPLLVESRLTPALAFCGRCETSVRPVENNLAAIFNALEIFAKPCDSRLVNEVTLDAADINVITLDLGKTRLIRPGFDVLDMQGRGRIELYYDLSLNDRPTAMMGFGSAREGFCDSVSAPLSGDHFSTLQPRGCRFVTLRLTGEGRCRLKLNMLAIDYPFENAHPSPVSNPRLTQIWNVSCETLRSCANDVFVDTCSRENVLWTLDACLSGKAAFVSFGDSKLWRRCLSLIAQGISPEGIPHSVVPAQDSFMMLFDQAMYFVVSCKEYAALTGDASLTQEVWPAVRRFLNLCRQHVTAEGFFVPPAYSWHFVDWAPFEKKAYSFPINGMLLLALDAAATYAPQEERSVLADAANRLRQSLARFWDTRSGCFLNHLEPQIALEPESIFGAPDSNQTIPHSLHTNALALLGKVGSENQRQQAAAWMAAIMMRPLGEENKFGPGWTEMVLDPLFDHGHGHVAIDFTMRIYGQLLDAGAPTWAEGFSSAKFNTAHGWGGVVNCLLAKRAAEIG